MEDEERTTFDIDCDCGEVITALNYKGNFEDGDKNWNNNAIQFPRLIMELEQVGVFTDEVMTKLAVEMDLSQLEVAELIDRACATYDKIKADTHDGEYCGNIKVWGG
jgi:hypothetical protein